MFHERSILLDCDDIHDFTGYVDFLFDRFALDEGLDAFIRFGGGNGIVFGDIDSELRVAAILAIDLEDDFYRIFDQLAFVVFRPTGFGDTTCVAQSQPELFADVGCEWGEQLDEAFDCLTGQALDLGQLVHADHHLRDGRVKAESRVVIGHLLDRCVEQALGLGVEGAFADVCLQATPSPTTSRQTLRRKRATPSMPLVFHGFIASSGPRNMR